MATVNPNLEVIRVEENTPIANSGCGDRYIYPVYNYQKTKTSNIKAQFYMSGFYTNRYQNGMNFYYKLDNYVHNIGQTSVTL